jgi:hypothetical protein
MTTKEKLIQELEQASDVTVEALLDFLHNGKIHLHDRLLEKNMVVIKSKDSKIDYQIRKPIWQVAQELTADLPQELIDQLPTDGAEQHDHYIYGTPKHQ